MKNEINAVISLFDIDLPVLSANRMFFDQIGVRLLVSSERVISVCNDKWKTYNYLIDNRFLSPKTYLTIETAATSLDLEEVSFPLIIKPRRGMGSIGVYEVHNKRELEVAYQMVKREIDGSYLKSDSTVDVDVERNVVIQEKLRGQEYGLDVINNLDGVYQNTIVKKKYSMRSGETDCAEIVDNIEMTDLGKRIGSELMHIANLDVDSFIIDGEPVVLEMNPRFGGGYPFSHLAGVNLPLAIVKWLRNEHVHYSLLEGRTGVLGHKDIGIQDISCLLP